MGGADSGFIHVCDFTSPLPLKTLPSHADPTNIMKLSHSKNFFLTASEVLTSLIFYEEYLDYYHLLILILPYFHLSNRVEGHEFTQLTV